MEIPPPAAPLAAGLGGAAVGKGPGNDTALAGAAYIVMAGAVPPGRRPCVCVGVCADMCFGMYTAIRLDIRVDMCGSMRMGVCADMRVDTCGSKQTAVVGRHATQSCH